MKRNTVIWMVILFVCIAAVGVVGITRMNRDAPASEGMAENSAGMSASSIKVATGNAAEWLDVAVPASVPSQRKDYTGFTLSFNSANRTPNWVAWELLGAETEGNRERHNKFWQDEEVKGCPEHKDYSRSGYDRGHMCPAADQKWSEEAMVDCFSLANIVPQDHSLNSGAWSTLESKERLWAKRDSAILIVAGPIYNASDKTRIGEAGVRVPSAFFKVLAAPYAANPRGIAFVYPNMTAPGNMENYVMTIRDVEKITGYDFFHNMPDQLEDAIETKSSFRDWNRRN